MILETLSGILARGDDAAADAIVWTIGFDGVTGTVHAYSTSDHTAARATFDQWTWLVGAKLTPESTTPNGGTSLVASRRYGTGTGRHVVVLRLDLDPARKGSVS